MSAAAWTQRILNNHAAEVADGEHDEACEWRPNGHFICNCAARRRIAAGFTEPPGELIHQYPICPRCNEEVSHNGDEFECRSCNCFWPRTTGPAEFYDDHGDLSESVARYDRMAQDGEP